MARALGELYSLDGSHLGYFIYSGMCDVAYSRIYDRAEDALARDSGHHAECTCKEPTTLAILYSHYGGGFYWLGRVCLKCRVLAAGFSPGFIDGHPWQKEEHDKH